MRAVFVAALLVLGVLGLGASTAQTPADRERARIQVRLGWEAMRAENWDEAAEAFARATDIDGTFEYAYYSLGRAHLGGKRFTPAIAALSRCADLHRAVLGRQFASVQDAQRYRRDRMVEIDEQIRQLQTGRQTMQTQNLARELQNQKRELQERINQGNSVTISTSVPAFVTLSLGSAYFRAGRFQEAEREYKTTVDADPKSGEAYNNLAVVYLETGRAADALAALESARRAGFRVNPQLEQEVRKRTPR